MKAIYVYSILIVLILLIMTTQIKPFEDYMSIIFKNEGGKTVDTGGLTNYGISDLADGKADGKFFGEDIATMTKERAAQIYKKEYFSFAQNFVKYPNFSLHVFDISVNSGISKAKDLVSKALKSSVLADQLAILTNLGDEKATEALKNQRVKFYNDLAENNPAKYGKYQQGWLNRVRNTKFA